MIKPRILLAEDDPLVRDALVSLLGELGEVVGVVEDGQELVKAAQGLKPDIIISDISMPKLNSLDAIRALQNCAPQSKVIVTNYTNGTNQINQTAPYVLQNSGTP